MPSFTIKSFVYPFVIESMYLSLLCLSAALLSYTGFQNYSLIRHPVLASLTALVLFFQHQSLQDFIKPFSA